MPRSVQPAREVQFSAKGLTRNHPSKPQYLLPSSKSRAMVKTSVFSSAKLFSFTHGKYPDGDNGKIYYPTFIFGSQDVKGLVLMAHGELSNGYEQPYKYAMDHVGIFLAMLGFVCISIQPRRSSKYPHSYADGTGDTFLRHLENCNGSFGSPYYIKGKPVALIGHSQAGGSVIEAGAYVKSVKFAGYEKVDAIVSLAGTYPERYDLTDAFLGMQGSLDRDSNSVGTPRFAVTVYDRLKLASERYFLWMHGCNHRQYTKSKDGVEYDLDPASGSTGLIYANTQNIVTAQYTAMFLLWKLAALTEYRAVFTGDEYVKFVSSDQGVQSNYDIDLKVFPRSDRLSSRDLGALPSAVSFQGMFQGGIPIFPDTNPATFDSLANLEVTCAGHMVSGFVVGWDRTTKFTQPRMMVKCSPVVMKLAIKAIEFHAVLVADPDTQKTQEPVTARVYLWLGVNSVSAIVPVLIAPPWSAYPHQASILNTVRIPIELFALTPDQLKTVTTFVLDFAKAERVQGLVAVTGFRAALA